jgi:FdhE protein
LQRILQPGEIETLDRIDFPRIRVPEPAALFADRARRLRQLATHDHPLRDYLRFAALLVEAQAAAATRAPAASFDAAVLERALANGMPVLDPAQELDAAWRDALGRLLDAVLGDATLPAPLADTARALRGLDAATLDGRARAALRDEQGPHDLAARPLLMAALQVAFTVRAASLSERQVPAVQPATVCPVCGSAPVASVLRIGGSAGGHRYLHCGLCATEWHAVRVKCSHCESTRGVRYRGIEGQPAVLAETCDVCRTYRKQADQEKDPLAEPLADDLATLALDLLLAETPYARASGNPLLALPRAEDP